MAVANGRSRDVIRTVSLVTPEGKQKPDGSAAPPDRAASGARARYFPRHIRTGSRFRRLLLAGFVDGGIIAVCVLILGLFVRTFVAHLYVVPSGSMEQTLRVGDTVVASRLTPRVRPLRRGDIVVFRDPGGWLPAAARPEHTPRNYLRSSLVFIGLIPQNSGQHLVKRVIGLAGDTVECDSRGTLTVNRAPLAEPYIYPGERSCGFSFRVTVPRDGIWVMGDHRSVSADSRFHRDNNDGVVPMRTVVGRVAGVMHNGRLRGL